MQLKKLLFLDPGASKNVYWTLYLKFLTKVDDFSEKKKVRVADGNVYTSTEKSVLKAKLDNDIDITLNDIYILKEWKVNAVAILKIVVVLYSAKRSDSNLFLLTYIQKKNKEDMYT
eukprot:snap_masked-scaffold_64-processed-gene-0.42-mRNA-1 protein AED:1.00 eAED:1.00 QI:0/0/0/0/1/1/2/0/115